MIYSIPHALAATIILLVLYGIASFAVKVDGNIGYL